MLYIQSEFLSLSWSNSWSLHTSVRFFEGFWRYFLKGFFVYLQQELPLLMRCQGRAGGVMMSIDFGPGHLTGPLQRMLVSACSQLFHVPESRASPFLNLGSNWSIILFESTAVTLWWAAEDGCIWCSGHPGCPVQPSVLRDCFLLLFSFCVFHERVISCSLPDRTQNGNQIYFMCSKSLLEYTELLMSTF